MIITGALILYGPYAPDPTYKNLYLYDTETVETDPNKIPREFFIGLRNADGTQVPIFRYSVPFPEHSTIYPIGETDTGFTVELPTDDGFPTKPVYIIITDSTTGAPVYRYAFIEGYQRTGSQKIRCACRFDQWTEHYADIMAAEFTFSRRHQKRYVNRAAATRVKLYNGLSDPIPEGMVTGTVAERAVLPYGVNALFFGNKQIIPIWLYWRMATNEFSTKTGETWNDPVPMYGVDPFKASVPVLASCLGIAAYDTDDGTYTIYPLWSVHKSDNTVLTDCGVVGGQHTEVGALAQMIVTTRTGHPYIAQSWVSTIPPFAYTIQFEKVDNVSVISRPVLRIQDPRFDTLRTPGDGLATDYRIGPAPGEDTPAPLVVQNGTFITTTFANNEFYPEGDVARTTITSDRETTTFDPFYEPKIEETPYTDKTLKMYGAEIPVAPGPAAPSIEMAVTMGAHNDIVLRYEKTINQFVELYRASGVCSQFGTDVATDSLTSWLLANYQTYQNTKLWKTIGTLVSGGTSIVGGLVTENPLAVLGGGTMIAKGIGEMVSGEKARMADLRSSPNATTIASENAFDNLPFIDLPRIRERSLPSDVKTRIMNFWHVYGYPDNKIGTIEDDATLRESFSYVEGALVNVLPGVYPGEVSEILGALRAGAWLWKCTVVHEAKNVKAVTDWVYTDRLTPFLSLQNKEVI